MPITVSPCASIEEMVEALRPIWHYFGWRPAVEDAERSSRILEVGRLHAARENGAIVGGAGAFTFELTVPGGTVDAAGVTVVGVLPTHRRRGILSAMMRAQLDDVHERGEPVAYLWASEEVIYGRFGYGLASLSGEIELPRAANAFSRPFQPVSRFRMVEEGEALEPFSQVYEQVRREYPGMFRRGQSWWTARRLADPENRRQGGGLLNRVVLTIDGRPEGYALYRMHQALESGLSTGFLNVLEAVATTPQATRDLWRFLLDVDWIGRFKAGALPVDHPLLFLLARPRSMRFRLSDGLWVRLVDVRAALAARSYGAGEPVVLDVIDGFCPWNQGCYRVGPDGVERTDADPDITLEAASLGSVYLGGFSFAQLAEAGRVEQRRANALARADALFERRRAPWCPEMF